MLSAQERSEIRARHRSRVKIYTRTYLVRVSISKSVGYVSQVAGISFYKGKRENKRNSPSAFNLHNFPLHWSRRFASGDNAYQLWNNVKALSNHVQKKLSEHVSNIELHNVKYCLRD